jgi:hypothetical protein
MFVFAIETCGKTVAYTKETDRIMLDGILNGERGEGQMLRKMTIGKPNMTRRLWDGVSPFTARLASTSEEIDYDIVANEWLQKPDFNTIVVDSGVLFILPESYSVDDGKTWSYWPLREMQWTGR